MFSLFCSGLLASSADNAVNLFDAETGNWSTAFSGHRGVVNSISPTRRSPEMLASASDDKTIKVDPDSDFFVKF